MGTNFYMANKPVCLNLAACNGIGDLISATLVIKKLSESYQAKITVLSPMPELFKNHPDVSDSFKFSSVDFDYFNSNYIVHNSFYNVGKKNERGIEIKHNRIDIRQFHAINLGFMLKADELSCFYRPTEPRKNDIFPKRKYVVIHPVSNWPSRTWNAINWMKLTTDLNELGFDVVSVGKDSSEKGFFNIDKPVFNFEISNGLNLMNKTSISDCWHLINEAVALVTMDSGLLHLAGTTDTYIIHLGSSISPQFRAPYRNNTQSYKYDYVRGTCALECGSDMKYGVEEWGNIHGVPPIIRCLENKPTFECHPNVAQVINSIKNVS